MQSKANSVQFVWAECHLANFDAALHRQLTCWLLRKERSKPNFFCSCVVTSFAKQSHSQNRNTFTNKLKHVPHKKTEFGCTNFDAGLHRHLTVLRYFGEPRGAPVVKSRSDWFARCSPGPTRETLPRTGSLLLLSARSRRSSDEPF